MGGGIDKVTTSIRLTLDTRKRLEEFCVSHYNAEMSTVVEVAIKEFLERRR